jgi:hypothetical protein
MQETKDITGTFMGQELHLRKSPAYKGAVEVRRFFCEYFLTLKVFFEIIHQL